MSAPVLFEKLPAAGRGLGRITLNVESTLNSLTLEMVDLLQVQLDAWRDDDSIGAHFLHMLHGDLAAGEQVKQGISGPPTGLRREADAARVDHGGRARLDDKGGVGVRDEQQADAVPVETSPGGGPSPLSEQSGVRQTSRPSVIGSPVTGSVKRSEKPWPPPASKTFSSSLKGANRLRRMSLLSARRGET